LPGIPVWVKIDGAEDFAFVRGHLIPRSDFAVRAQRIVVRLLDQRLDDLLLAHGGNLFRIPRLRIEPTARHDGHAGLHRDLAQEVDVASRVLMPGVDEAGDAVALDLCDFLGHQIDVAHNVRGRGRGSAAGSGRASLVATTAAARRGGR
jgi:hypothetical protein